MLGDPFLPRETLMNDSFVSGRAMDMKSRLT